MTKRIALIVHTQTYFEPKLAQLGPSTADAAALADLLRDPTIGNFDEVEMAVNPPAAELRRQVAGLFQHKQRHDELLLYLVGYFLTDEAGQLHFATVDTRLAVLAETALSAAYLTGCMDRSFSRRQMLLLDGCCFHLSPTKTAATIHLDTEFNGRGYGRVVLASISGDISIWVSSAWICQSTPLSPDLAIRREQHYVKREEAGLTHRLIQALQTGTADADGDGQIEVKELYHYLRQQTDQVNLRVYSRHDHFIIARNPYHFIPAHPIKWDLISGAILAPITIIAIGGRADLRTAIGLAGLLLLMYALLYLAPD